MTARSVRIAQTTKEVKKEHKKNRYGISDNQLRVLQRDALLDERAKRFREQEERKRAAKKKREAKERKEMEARRQLGVGLATQLVGYSHTQAQLKKGMESFLGFKKRKPEDNHNVDVQKKLQQAVEVVDTGPWENEHDDEPPLDVLPELDAALGSSSFADTDLDDDTLLEAVEAPWNDKHCLGSDPATSKPIPAMLPPAPVNTAPKDEAAFRRVHGPVNWTTEEFLEALPSPLFELLSTDSGTDPCTWAPPASLLYKLHPPHVPPHRLRLKIGCVVTLLDHTRPPSLRSEEHHLRVLHVLPERIVCSLLNAPSEGSRTLTRQIFRANYRNDPQYPFQRLQFPIKVLPRQMPMMPALHRMPDTVESTTKLPQTIPQRPRPSAQISLLVQHSPPDTSPTTYTSGDPTTTMPPSSLDEWGELLASSTQLAREIADDSNEDHRENRSLQQRSSQIGRDLKHAHTSSNPPTRTLPPEQQTRKRPSPKPPEAPSMPLSRRSLDPPTAARLHDAPPPRLDPPMRPPPRHVAPPGIRPTAEDPTSTTSPNKQSVSQKLYPPAEIPLSTQDLETLFTMDDEDDEF
ncbi:hypothetical protein M011DRAFT_466740 [Sporormia fimetaria CBS 119925]|uniref:Uncharacterized protein n=1 Tax=Sporormia fimetaria CBS 119925 TaxID=1340428 RepID=A0A6A6VDQ5_9PLEO|nr:hypothetical protein M011DRAFT_466740 [Sporormia fimetaria CBS 119925]